MEILVAVSGCGRYRSEEYIGQRSKHLERRRILHLSVFQITEFHHKNTELTKSHDIPLTLHFISSNLTSPLEVRQEQY